MLKNKTFEKVRRYALWTAICSAAVLLVLEVLQTWGAFKTTTPGDYSSDFMDYSGGTTTFWGHLLDSFGVVFGISAGLLIVILFVIPRKKN